MVLWKPLTLGDVNKRRPDESVYIRDLGSIDNVLALLDFNLPRHSFPV